tara:strand:- start:103 stop:840 length:738 start_codon:yes stop_codon:yes gene_type:complete
MTFVYEVCNEMEKWAPLELAEPWDNVGLMVGDRFAEVKRILCSLDIDRFVWNHISENDYDLIITHHPLLFKPITEIDNSTMVGRIIKRLMKKNITLLSYHTNLDKAEGGVNDALIEAYDLNPKDGNVFDSGYGKWFELEEVTPLSRFTELFPAKVSGAIGVLDVKRVGFCGGSGKSLVNDLKKERIDLFITGEFGYHESIECDFYGIKVLELGHKESEVLVLSKIKDHLNKKYKELDIKVLSNSF